MTASGSDLASAKLPAPTLKNLTFSLAIGTGGGFLFSLLNLPLPWMLGAMAATAWAAACGKPVAMSRHMRQIMIAVIGVLLGSAFNPEMLGQIPQWLASLAVLFIFMAFLGLAVPWLLRRSGYDSATAYFAALPAGLTEMTIVGSENGGNGQIIALTHTVRVLLVAFAVPFSLVILLGYERPTLAVQPAGDFTPFDIGLLTTCALGGLWLGNKMNLPAGALAAPLALSAAAHLTGLTTTSPPSVLVAIAQVVLGTSVGARFSGLTIATTRRTVFLATVVTIGMLLLSGFAAFSIGPLIGVEPLALLLALSPGGVTEMSLMALALDQDIAYVTTHHVARIALIIMIGPAVFSLASRFTGNVNQSSTRKNQE